MAVTVEKNEQGIPVAIRRAQFGPHTVTETFINEVDVEVALRYMAAAMDSWSCRNGFCESCNPARLAWWKLCNSLSKSKRVELQSLLREAGVLLPETPYVEQ